MSLRSADMLKAVLSGLMVALLDDVGGHAERSTAELFRRQHHLIYINHQAFDTCSAADSQASRI